MPKKNTQKTDQPIEDVEQQTEQGTAEGTEEGNVDNVSRIHCTEIDINRLSFGAQEMKKEGGQLSCFVKYLYGDEEPTEENIEKDSKNLVVLTDPIDMSKGCIPRHDPQYHGTDKDSMKRAFFYIPKNENDPASMELFNKIKEIDDYLVEEINIKKNANGLINVLVSKGTGKNASFVKKKVTSITYSRMITTTKKPGGDMIENDDDDDSSKKGGKGGKFSGQQKEFVPWDRIKVRFMTLYEEGSGADDKKPITTQVYIGDNEDAEDCTTVTQIEKYFSRGCIAQFVLMFSRFYIMTTENKNCGFVIKCVQLGVTKVAEPRKNVSITKQLNKSLFAKRGIPPITKKPDTENNNDESKTEFKTASKSAVKTVATTAGKSNSKTQEKTPAKTVAKSVTASKTTTKTTGKPSPKVVAPKEAEENTEDTEGTDVADGEDGADVAEGGEAEVADGEAEDTGNNSEPEVDTPPKKQATNGKKNDVKVKAKVVEKTNTAAKTIKKTGK